MRIDTDIENAIAQYGDDVLRACTAYLGSRHRAVDAFQETFLKFALDGTVFRTEDHCKAWLLRVAINTCKDMLKKASTRDVELNEDFDGPAHDDEAGAIVERDRVSKALAMLPDGQRRALVLTAIEGYTAVQAAKIMKMPVNTVYSHITRGKSALREVLSNG